MLLIKENLKEIDMKEYVDSLLLDIQETVHHSDPKDNNHNPYQCKVPLRESVYLGLIINELVTNTYKYAFDDNTGYNYDIFNPRKKQIYY